MEMNQSGNDNVIDDEKENADPRTTRITQRMDNL
jgi:hypothetical protein